MPVDGKMDRCVLVVPLDINAPVCLVRGFTEQASSLRTLPHYTQHASANSPGSAVSLIAGITNQHQATLEAT